MLNEIFRLILLGDKKLYIIFW